ncbi:hypothetical protein Pla110_07200 [Polystyrenella longa]|uniref:Lipoprotein n=1 Tax=Polystyrenella longa TaxID=2528007 RepID=A0A518CIE3_9PLAN|nr:hypothetical protein [Polystyrenella longa]QDU79016.1 hypothetical protein Pla110_07200 [Polystyrenella longa]
MRKFMICCLLVALSGGCAMLEEETETAISETKRQFRIKPNDYHDNTEDPDEDWSFVGDQGRAGMPKERDNDRVLRKYLMSEKARSIESNLGIE